MNDRQIFMENIRLRRAMKKWTQEDLAKKAKLSQATISQVEAGGKDPSLEAIILIAKALGVNVRNLFEKLKVAS